MQFKFVTENWELHVELNFLFQTDDEWDAILGELSVLESQFDSELYTNHEKSQTNVIQSPNKEPKV